MADICDALLCLYCEKTTHKSKDCHLLTMPKPVAVTYGVCRNELIFHEILMSSEVTFRHDSGKVGKISVDGDSLTPQDIVNELEWIILGEHQWDLRPTDDGVFKDIFPSNADLDRMTKIINVPIQGTGMYLHFEEWFAAEIDKFHLTEVWVRVHGCCYKERCDYLSLFGVGSLIGKALEVDMEFTRSHSVVHMRVEVTRKENIPPTTVDHVYDGEGYDLIFKVEGAQVAEKVDIIMDDANHDNDSKKSQSKKGEQKGSDLAKGSERTNNSNSTNLVLPNTGNVKQTVQYMHAIMIGSLPLATHSSDTIKPSYSVEPSKVAKSHPFLKVGSVGVQVLSEASMNKQEARSSSTPPSASRRTPGGGPGLSNVTRSNVVMMSGGYPWDAGTGVFLGGRYSMEEVVAFGGIPAKAAEV
ncbi:hypothetical protein ACQ4PT_031104 [Festuca glaucescens]